MKQIFLISGVLSLLLGVVGIILPIVPTTPLLMVSCYCFSKSSAKFHNLLINSNLYKEYAKEFVENRTLTLKKKIILLSFASTMLLFPLVILDFGFKLVIIVVYIYLYYYFIFKISTSKI